MQPRPKAHNQTDILDLEHKHDTARVRSKCSPPGPCVVPTQTFRAAESAGTQAIISTKEGAGAREQASDPSLTS